MPTWWIGTDTAGSTTTNDRKDMNLLPDFVVRWVPQVALLVAQEQAHVVLCCARFATFESSLHIMNSTDAANLDCGDWASLNAVPDCLGLQLRARLAYASSVGMVCDDPQFPVHWSWCRSFHNFLHGLLCMLSQQLHRLCVGLRSDARCSSYGRFLRSRTPWPSV
ncbi:unnamed protein product [Amoebophrya sp. A25]|nr:unnamed protein product [Amoebophrya sp. A25]|eukprot:GSA25T00007282001.1